MQIQRYVEHRADAALSCNAKCSCSYRRERDPHLWYVSAAWCALVYLEKYICLCVQRRTRMLSNWVILCGGAYAEALSCVLSLSAHKFEANIKIAGLPFDIVIKRAPQWCGIAWNLFAITHQVNATRLRIQDEFYGVC